MKATIQYSAALEEIQQATREGKIKWVRNRPDSFKFKTLNDDLEDLILTFQKIENDYYLTLTKKDFENSEVLLNLDSNQLYIDLKDNLRELFDLVEYHVDLQNLEGLTKFLDVVNNSSSKKSLFD